MIEILEEEVDGVILTVTAQIRLRVRVDEKIKFVKSNDIIEIIRDKYDIIGTVKDNQLSNSMRGGGKQRGQWMFQVRKKKPAAQKPAPRKRPASKPAPKPAPKMSQKPPVSVSVAETQAKPSTKRSIRGRMSKIVEEKINKNTKE
jgi:hypothetical protein